MITSKQIVCVSEGFLTSVNGFNGRSDVFINPSSSDYKEIYKSSKYHSVKFIADNKKKEVYVWNADAVIHYNVANKLNLIDRVKSNDLLTGDANLSNGGSIMNGSDELTGLYKNVRMGNKPCERQLKKMLRTDWSWVNHYVSIKDWFSGFSSTVNNYFKTK